jgi:hypothetical protein
MSNLLESVQTDRLAGAFEKYLPAVLANKAETKSEKTMVTESRKAVTGDKTAKKVNVDDSNIVDIKVLAGLK